jgi:hypothetical protein
MPDRYYAIRGRVIGKVRVILTIEAARIGP